MTDLGTDILLERPYGFEVNGEKFAIFPPSLGVLSTMQILLRKLNISQSALQSVGNLELLRVAKAQCKECCELIAFATCSSHADVLNDIEIERRAKLFAEGLESSDIATLLVASLQFNRHQQWMEDVGIREEHNRIARVMRCKKKGNSVSFGGKTLFGRLIDPAMERYGWTYEYVVWGISFAVLEALMADKIVDIFLTDDEKKKVPAYLLETEDVISGDDPRNWERIEKLMNMQ